MTVSDAFEKFMLSKKLAGLSENTIVDYKAHLRGFLSYAGNDCAVQDITEDLVQGYIFSLYGRALKKASVNTYIRNLRIFLTYVDKISALSFSPASIKIPRTPKKQLRIYSDDEIRQIFDNIRHSIKWIQFRNCTIIALMLDSGLRQSEVSSLRRKDVSFSPPRLLVHGKGDKERFVPLGNVSAHFLQQYWASCPFPPGDYVFLSDSGEKLTKNAIRLFVTRLAKRLPFELSSHKLRHNFATNYCLDKLNAGEQVDAFTLKTLMGHADISTTERYIHCAVELMAVKSIMSHLDRILDVS